MALKISLKDGYWSDPGVFSGQTLGAASAQIKHTVCLKAGATMSAANITFTSGAAGAGILGTLGIPDGVTSQLKIGSNATLRFVSVGSMVPVLNAAYIPAGQK